MMKGYIFFFTLIIILKLSAAENNPKIMGASWSNGSILAGIDAINNNPSNLGLSDNVNASMTLAFLPFPNFSLMAENSFSVSVYNDYFSEGGDNSWSTADINRILDQLNGKWRLQNRVSMDLISLTQNNRGWSFGVNSIQNISIPEDFLEFILKGSELGKVYDAEELDAEVLNFYSFGMSYAAPVKQTWLDRYFKEFSIGGTLRFIHSASGVEMDDLEEGSDTKLRPAYLKLKNIDSYISTGSVTEGSTVVKGEFEILVSEAGMGFGSDLGFSGVLSHNGNMKIGLTFNNLYSVINWYKSNRIYKYQYIMDGILISDLEGNDSLFTENENSENIGNFYTSLPVEMKLDYVWKLFPKNQNFFWTSSYIQGFSDRLYSTYIPRFSTGFEWFHNSASWFRLRSGITLGGQSFYSSAAGMSLQFAHYSMDLAVENKYLYGDGSKGLSFAIGQKILW